jgi:hypothetical protein
MEAELEDSDRSREDDWFRRNERELLEAARLARAKRERERAAHEAAEESARLKALHFMKCPKCGHDLHEQVLEGVSVDRCAFCEGIFLDAGELDSLFMKRDEERKGFLAKLLGA